MKEEEVNDCLNIDSILNNSRLNENGVLKFLELLLQGEYHIDRETGAIFKCEYNQTYSESEMSLDEFINKMNTIDEDTILPVVVQSLLIKLKNCGVKLSKWECYAVDPEEEDNILDLEPIEATDDLVALKIALHEYDGKYPEGWDLLIGDVVAE